METALYSTDLGNCGNCQLPFLKECSKVKRIIVTRNETSPAGTTEEDEEIISIYEALSVVFEVPPLQPSDTEMDIGKGMFKSVGKETGSDQGFALCVNCSEMLKALYRNFKDFTSVCKLDSDIGKILRRLDRAGVTPNEQAYSGNQSTDQALRKTGDEDANNGVNVKIEPQSEDEPLESENEQENREIDRNIEMEMDENIVKVLPESDDEDGPSSPDAQLSDYGEPEEPAENDTEPTRVLRTRNTNRSYCTSDDDQHAEIESRVTTNYRKNSPSIQTKVINLTNGFITQLKCPQCTKKFLHENTLACHRRIIHGENISLRPPEPLAQRKLTAQQDSERLKALANAGGKTSACPICRLEVARTDIRNHLATHTRSLSKPWLCTICGRNFNDHDSLHSHSKEHIRGLPCKRCGKKIPTLEIINHSRRCMGSTRRNQTSLNYARNVCHKSFQSSQQLAHHRSRAHGNFWKCKLCGIKFNNREKMKIHMISHKQKKSHKCKICDKCFDRIDVLRLHVKRFHRNNEGPPSVLRSMTPEECEDADFDCDMSEAMPTSLSPPSETCTINTRGSNLTKQSNHKVSSNAEVDFSTPIVENRFRCKGCGMTFARASELDNHLVENHTDGQTFLCNICNRTLLDTYCLKLHVKTHGEMKPLECFYPNCGKIYRDKNTFFYHLKEKHGMQTKSIITKYPDVFRQQNRDYSTRVATRKKIGQSPSIPKRGKFPCEKCGRIFPTVYGLRSHVKLVHDKIKDFLCKYCGKAFARKSYFLIHEKLHTSNEAPYKCHLCGKGFRLPGNLRMHLQSTIHNPNRDFVCEICGKGFNRNDNLRLHVKTVHLKIPIRKPKTDQSDRYAHGGRNRIYIGADDSSADNASNATAAKIDVAGDESAVSSANSDPVPGTSYFFLSQQNPPLPTDSLYPSIPPVHRFPGMATHLESPSTAGSSHSPEHGASSRSSAQTSVGKIGSQYIMPISLQSQDLRGRDSGHQQHISQDGHHATAFQYR